MTQIISPLIDNKSRDASWSSGKLLKLLLIAGISLDIAGCGFDPSQPVQSPTQPQPVEQDGIDWFAIRVSNTSDQWFWVPGQAAVVCGNASWPTGYSVDVIANDQFWQVTKTTDGFSYAKDTTAEVEANPGLVAVAICLAIGVLISLGSALHFAAARTEERERAYGLTEELKAIQGEEAQRNRDFARERSTLEKKLESVARAQARERAAIADERAVLDAERTELEQQKRTVAVAAQTSMPPPKSMTAEDWKAASDTVRARAFSGQAMGTGLIVRYIIDPERSGFIVFHWETTLGWPIPPTFAAYRNGEKFHEQSGVAHGEFADVLVNTRERNQYRFALIDRGRELPGAILLEPPLPPMAGWKPEPPPPESAEERMRRKEAWREKEYQRAAEYITDPVDLKLRRAQIDAEICEKFGEE